VSSTSTFDSIVFIVGHEEGNPTCMTKYKALPLDDVHDAAGLDTRDSVLRGVRYLSFDSIVSGI